jgi:hypothetical protein
LTEDDIKEALLTQIKFMEKEILYLKGKMRIKSKKAYLNLLKSSINILGLDNPIYLMRCE